MPVQERSEQLVADILQAAVRVLEREGAKRFTTIRVAEAAGVSVGSLYQYFPNKEAILYRLQVDEWRETGAVIDAILSQQKKSPAVRLREMVRAFFVSECAEGPLRAALAAAAPSYHDAPESEVHRAENDRITRAFIAAAAPHASAGERRFAAELMFAVVTSVGKRVSESPHTARDIDRWADAVTNMLLAHLRTLRGGAK